MSHQVNFYATPLEIAVLEESWRALAPMTVLHSRSKDAEPRELASSELEEDGQRWLFFYLVRFSDLSAVVTRHVPKQGYWSVDVMRSPVIEFTRCFFDEKVLRRGRLYVVDGYYGDDPKRPWVEKADDFKKWAKSILSATKKKLLRHQSDYIGQDARSWLQSSGGRLLS